MKIVASGKRDSLEQRRQPDAAADADHGETGCAGSAAADQLSM